METPCACGCGEIVVYKPLAPSRLFHQGPKRYVAGHQNRGRTHTPEQIAKQIRRGWENGRWQGGWFKDRDGYILTKQPSHPHARQSGYVLDHRLVMEAYLGRILEPHEVVHHRNGNKSDNRIENLELLTGQAAHIKIERTGRKFPRASGVWFVCQQCQVRFYRSAYWKEKSVRFCSWACRYSS